MLKSLKLFYIVLVGMMQALYMLGDITAGPAFRFTQWLQLVRKRAAKYRSSGFPHRPSAASAAATMPSRLLTTTYLSLSFPKTVIGSVNCKMYKAFCWML